MTTINAQVQAQVQAQKNVSPLTPDQILAQKQAIIKAANDNVASSDFFMSLINDIASPLYNRKTEVAAMLVAIFSKLNVVLIGEPGTAKTKLAKRVLNSLPKPSFQAILNPFSDPDDIVGPLSIKSIREEDKRVRMVDGYLPHAKVAFLDEIFKATGATLTALLSLLNERIYTEEGKIKQSTLMSVIGASNEYPTEESGALADRFALWIPIEASKSIEELLTFAMNAPQEQANKVLITPELLAASDKRIDAIIAKPTNQKQIIATIVKFKELLDKSLTSSKEGKLSDRSMVQCTRLLAASCMLRGSMDIITEDAWIFRYLSRQDEYARYYVDATQAMLKSKEFLSKIIDALSGLNINDPTQKSEIVKLSTNINKAPIHWQIELQPLLADATKGKIDINKERLFDVFKIN